jgi:hypothetical protein
MIVSGISFRAFIPTVCPYSSDIGGIRCLAGQSGIARQNVNPTYDYKAPRRQTRIRARWEGGPIEIRTASGSTLQLPRIGGRSFRLSKQIEFLMRLVFRGEPRN